MEKMEMLKRFLAKYGPEAMEMMGKHPYATGAAGGAALGALSGATNNYEDGKPDALRGMRAGAALGAAGVGAYKGAGDLTKAIAELMAKYGAR